MQYSIGHVCYYVRNREAALDFYRDKLGLKMMFEQNYLDDAGEEAYIIYLRVAKSQFIELIGNIEHDDAPKVSLHHLCLHVDDIYATHKELKDKGLTLTDISVGLSKCIKCNVYDPDGNVIELMQLPEDSLQYIYDKD